MSDDEHRLAGAEPTANTGDIADTLNTVATQQEVLEYYRDSTETDGAVTVGGYVRVVASDSNYMVCKGPKSDTKHGWEIVEINWDSKSYLLAPKTEVER